MASTAIAICSGLTYLALDYIPFAEKPAVHGFTFWDPSLAAVSSSGALLISAIAGVAYAYVELINEGQMPEMFNPASYEGTGDGYGISITAVVIFYAIGLILTVVSLYLDNQDFKGAIPWVTLPVLAPIDLLAAF